MEDLFAEFSDVINNLLGSPNGAIHTFVVLFVAMTSLLLAMRTASSLLGMRHADWLPLGLSLLIGVYALAGLVATTNLYLLPAAKSSFWREIMRVGVPVGGFVLFCVPAQAELLKSSFWRTLAAFSASAVITLVAIGLVNLMFPNSRRYDDSSVRPVPALMQCETGIRT